ncbi:MAG: hypothetical protein P8177_12730 [Gemmatimonadota bacterium]|jgi:hypothetical protein
MPRRFGPEQTSGRCRSCDLMREELCHALMEALYELDVLPCDEDGAFVGLYAIIDDLQAAIRRTESMDLARSA